MKSASPLIALLLLIPGIAPSAGELQLVPAPPAPTTATVQKSGLQFDFAVKLDGRPLASATLHGDPLFGNRYEGGIRLDVAGRDNWQIAVKLSTTEYDRKSAMEINIYDADRIVGAYCNTVPLFTTTLAYRGSGIYELFAVNGTSVSVTVRDDAFVRPYIVRTGRAPAPQKPAKPAP